MNRTIKNTLLLLGFFTMHKQSATAQQLTEKTSLRLYEHHSSAKTNAEFGSGADGTQSAYNFAEHKYVSSFNMGNYKAYPINSSVPAGIDMVEHNGPFGNGGGFAFTSGESSIWQQNGPPYIRGNGQTLYYRAPSNFNYETIMQESEIKNAFVESSATTSVNGLAEGNVYIAKLRNLEKYLAIKITNVKENTQSSGDDDVYFDFRYKYAGTATGMNKLKMEDKVSFYPNPATSTLTIQLEKPGNNALISIYNLNGQLLKQVFPNVKLITNVDIRELTNGVYYVQVKTSENIFTNYKFVKI